MTTKQALKELEKLTSKELTVQENLFSRSWGNDALGYRYWIKYDERWVAWSNSLEEAVHVASQTIIDDGNKTQQPSGD